MKTELSLKQRSAIALLALIPALPVTAMAGRSVAARLTRGAAQPIAVAVNWNSGPSSEAPAPPPTE